MSITDPLSSITFASGTAVTRGTAKTTTAALTFARLASGDITITLGAKTWRAPTAEDQKAIFKALTLATP